MSSTDKSANKEAKKALLRKKLSIVDGTCVLIGLLLIGLVLFFGLDVIPFELAWVQDYGGWTAQHTLVMGVIVFVICLFSVLAIMLFYAGMQYTSFIENVRHNGIHTYDIRFTDNSSTKEARKQ